jgi:hypothetical protein
MTSKWSFSSRRFSRGRVSRTRLTAIQWNDGRAIQSNLSCERTTRWYTVIIPDLQFASLVTAVCCSPQLVINKEGQLEIQLNKNPCKLVNIIDWNKAGTQE